MIKTHNLSLLDPATGEVPEKSGLNWCHSDGHVSEGDAYIAIRENDLKSGLFPPKELPNESIQIIWDDGTKMEGLLEGNNNTTPIYPKQLCSRPRKNILGKYLRKRLGVSLDHVITKDDLKRYGRFDITISLNQNDTYSLDFSV